MWQRPSSVVQQSAVSAKDPENRSAGTDVQVIQGLQEICRDRREYASHEVDGQKADFAGQPFKLWPEQEQREHIEQQMHQSAMQEHRRDESPPLAFSDQSIVTDAIIEDIHTENGNP